MTEARPSKSVFLCVVTICTRIGSYWQTPAPTMLMLTRRDPADAEPAWNPKQDGSVLIGSGFKISDHGAKCRGEAKEFLRRPLRTADPSGPYRKGQNKYRSTQVIAYHIGFRPHKHRSNRTARQKLS
jgi:hypothetical protein